MRKFTKPNLSRLMEILKHKRPADSDTEHKFVDYWLVPKLPDPVKDEYGNIWVMVGEPKNVHTMFSCHTDTVHSNDGYQELAYDNVKHHLLTVDKDSSCLGADDGVGIWLMMHLIENKVPGLYIFHRDEEVGGGGSRHAASNYKDAFKYIKHCVAFDRPGVNEIITHQSGMTRCASDKYAEELRAHLPTGYILSNRGVFTDSYNYRGLIPECINLGVGYYNQHTKNEYLDMAHALKLAHSIVSIPWNDLGAYRDPAGEPRPERQKYQSTAWDHSSYDNWFNSTYVPPTYPRSSQSGNVHNLPATTKNKKRSGNVGHNRHKTEPTMHELLAWVRSNPRAAASLLRDFQVTIYDIEDADKYYGRDNRSLELFQPKPLRKVPLGGKKAPH